MGAVREENKGHIFINKANDTKNYYDFTFPCTTTAKCFLGPKKGRNSQVDEIALSSASEIYSKRSPYHPPSNAIVGRGNNVRVIPASLRITVKHCVKI